MGHQQVYGWIKGKNIIEAFEDCGLKDQSLTQNLKPVTLGVIDDLESKGYAVADMKPEHIIIDESDLLKMEQQKIKSGSEQELKNVDFLHFLVNQKRYSVVDYELLIRTPIHEKSVRESRRHSYLVDQRDRYLATDIPPL